MGGGMTTHDLINECAELFRAHDSMATAYLLERGKKFIPDVPMVPMVALVDTIRKGDYEAIKELQRQVEMWKGFAAEAERERDEARSSALEEAAKVCEQGATGVAVEIGTQTFPLGIMFKHGGDAQKATATALAAAVRALVKP